VALGIQFTRHFIEFVVVEMKQFVGSNVNVILTSKHAASARACLQEANAKGKEIIFTREFAIMLPQSK